MTITLKDNAKPLTRKDPLEAEIQDLIKLDVLIRVLYQRMSEG